MEAWFNICISINVIEQKSYHHLNRCRKSLSQSPTSFHDKSPELTGNRRDMPQHNKGYM
jgi:hypothetical protein